MLVIIHGNFSDFKLQTKDEPIKEILVFVVLEGVFNLALVREFKLYVGNCSS